MAKVRSKRRTAGARGAGRPAKRAKVRRIKVSAPVKRRKEAGPARAPAERQPGIARVLIVDDEAPVRKFVTEVLRASGYDVVGAATSSDFLAKAKREPFDLILLDSGVAETGGRAVLGRLRQIPTFMTPVVALPERLDPAAIVRAAETGAIEWVGKPLEPAELHRTVEMVICLTKSERRARREMLERAASVYASITELREGLHDDGPVEDVVRKPLLAGRRWRQAASAPTLARDSMSIKVG